MPKKKDEDVLKIGEHTVAIKTWPMRPGLKHVATLQSILQSVKFSALKGAEDGTVDIDTVLSAIDLNDIAEGYCDRLTALVADGCDLPAEKVNELSLADFTQLVVAIVKVNCHPLMGLLSRARSLSETASTPPRS